MLYLQILEYVELTEAIQLEVGQSLKSADKKLIKFAKKSIKNLIFHELGKMEAKELTKLYSNNKETSKIKMK